MSQEDKTKEEFIEEIKLLQKRIAELEMVDCECKQQQQEEDFRRLATVVRDSNDAITIQNFEGGITAWNRGATLMYGYNESEALGMSIERLTPLGKEVEQKEFTRRLMAGEAVTSFETQRVTKDGRILDVWLTVAKVLDDTGKPIGIVTTERDITERKRAEKALRESEEKYRFLFDNIPLPMGITTLDGRVLAANRSLEELTGYTKEEFSIPKDVSEMYVDRAQRKQLTALLQKEGKVRDFEAVLKRKDDTVYYALMNLDFIELGGAQAILSVVRDITERKKAEDMLRKAQEKYFDLFENANDAIYTTDTMGALTSFNRATLSMFGYPVEEFRQLTIKDFLVPEDYEAVTKLLQRATAEKSNLEELQPWQLHMVKKGGSIIHVEVRTCLIWEKGEIVGMQGIIRDNTERKRTEEMFEKVSKCFLAFGIDPDENIRKIVVTAGSILEGVCALYNKEEDALLCTIEGWNIPQDFKRKDTKEGHICYDVITKYADKPFSLGDLGNTPYAKTDPNIVKYGLKAYIGCAVRIEDKAVGSLCVVYNKNKIFTSTELNILSVFAKAVGIEEERRQTIKELQKRLKELEVFYMASVGREERIIELKKEIEQLKKESGK